MKRLSFRSRKGGYDLKESSAQASSDRAEKHRSGLGGSISVDSTTSDLSVCRVNSVEGGGEFSMSMPAPSPESTECVVTGLSFTALSDSGVNASSDNGKQKLCESSPTAEATACTNLVVCGSDNPVGNGVGVSVGDVPVKACEQPGGRRGSLRGEWDSLPRNLDSFGHFNRPNNDGSSNVVAVASPTSMKRHRRQKSSGNWNILMGVSSPSLNTARPVELSEQLSLPAGMRDVGQLDNSTSRTSSGFHSTTSLVAGGNLPVVQNVEERPGPAEDSNAPPGTPTVCVSHIPTGHCEPTTVLFPANTLVDEQLPQVETPLDESPSLSAAVSTSDQSAMKCSPEVEENTVVLAGKMQSSCCDVIDAYGSAELYSTSTVYSPNSGAKEEYFACSNVPEDAEMLDSNLNNGLRDVQLLGNSSDGGHAGSDSSTQPSVNSELSEACSLQDAKGDCDESEDGSFRSSTRDVSISDVCVRLSSGEEYDSDDDADKKDSYIDGISEDNQPLVSIGSVASESEKSSGVDNEKEAKEYQSTSATDVVTVCVSSQSYKLHDDSHESPEGADVHVAQDISITGKTTGVTVCNTEVETGTSLSTLEPISLPCNSPEAVSQLVCDVNLHASAPSSNRLGIDSKEKPTFSLDEMAIPAVESSNMNTLSLTQRPPCLALSTQLDRSVVEDGLAVPSTPKSPSQNPNSGGDHYLRRHTISTDSSALDALRVWTQMNPLREWSGGSQGLAGSPRRRRRDGGQSSGDGSSTPPSSSSFIMSPSLTCSPPLSPIGLDDNSLRMAVSPVDTALPIIVLPDIEGFIFTQDHATAKFPPSESPLCDGSGDHGQCHITQQSVKNDNSIITSTLTPDLDMSGGDLLLCDWTKKSSPNDVVHDSTDTSQLVLSDLNDPLVGTNTVEEDISMKSQFSGGSGSVCDTLTDSPCSQSSSSQLANVSPCVDPPRKDSPSPQTVAPITRRGGDNKERSGSGRRSSGKGSRGSRRRSTTSKGSSPAVIEKSNQKGGLDSQSILTADIVNRLDISDQVTSPPSRGRNGEAVKGSPSNTLRTLGMLDAVIHQFSCSSESLQKSSNSAALKNGTSSGGAITPRPNSVSPPAASQQQKPSAAVVSQQQVSPVQSPNGTSSYRGSLLGVVEGDGEPEDLPWGAKRQIAQDVEIDMPGEFVLKKLFTEFANLAERRIDKILNEELEYPLQKTLQRGEHLEFDQLLSTLSTVAEHCLPSLLKTLFAWYERQLHGAASPALRQKTKSKAGIGDRDYLLERRDLAVEFIFCLVLIEILKQLPYHPGYDDLISHTVAMAFSHFRQQEGSSTNPNAQNINTIADLYAEVIGTLAKSRFLAVKKRFLLEFRDLKAKESLPSTSSQMISLIMGMKFLRVKMHPIDEFEACINFLLDLAKYFIETKDKDVRHSLAGLFVEILLPMAAIARTEVNVPALRMLVETLYNVSFDLCTKKKHYLSIFPMVTCILCVSQNIFFLSHWPNFLTLCLQNLKNRDPKFSRVALESLYRLVWVYVIRVKCENNLTTNQRLGSITGSLFPKGQKSVMPRDTPLNIYVKIIQFIAQQRLDFAMKEVIYDLLYVGKPIKFLAPERMSIGLRAFLVITDSLQQREGEPPMPQTVVYTPSGSTLRVKKTFINKMLTDDTARKMGMTLHYKNVRTSLGRILILLDSQVGRPLIRTKLENVNKDVDEVITTERKPKIDLLRTCVAAIPRLIPSEITGEELTDLLIRLTVHVEEELKQLSYQALQNLMADAPSLRGIIVSRFKDFIVKEIGDTQPHLLEVALKRLQSLLSHWKSALQVADAQFAPAGSTEAVLERLSLREVEGLSLVMTCSCRPAVRRTAVALMKEVKFVCAELSLSPGDGPCLLDAIDGALPSIMEKMMHMHTVPPYEKGQITSAGVLDIQWVADRTSTFWAGAYQEDPFKPSTKPPPSVTSFDPWVFIIMELMNFEAILTSYSQPVQAAWPIAYTRLLAVNALMDPSNPANDTRSSSFIRGAKKGPSDRKIYLHLWKNYILFACRIAIKTQTVVMHVTQELSSSPESTSGLTSDLFHSSTGSSSSPQGTPPAMPHSAKDLFRLIVPYIKCEADDIRAVIIRGLGHVNPEAFQELIDELAPVIKEAVDRKQENVRRRKRRDTLRMQISKLFKLAAQNNIFSYRCVIDHKSKALRPTFIDYIDGMHQVLESEGERDPVLQDTRLKFCDFMVAMIKSRPNEGKEYLIKTELRYSLFNLLSTWSGSLGHIHAASDNQGNNGREAQYSKLELSAAQAMSAVLCCGSVFDQNAINEKEGYVYSWVNRLLASSHRLVHRLGQETIILLLESNSSVPHLLDWTIDRCYTGCSQVADGCFTALAKTFHDREYRCDPVASLNVALLYMGCPRTSMREMASQLLRLLCTRFLLDESSSNEEHAFQIFSADGTTMTSSAAPSSPTGLAPGGGFLGGGGSGIGEPLGEVMVGAYSRSQYYLSEQLARLHPELTMQLFSEIMLRFETAIPSIRHILLYYLLPWMGNIQLVNPGIPQGSFTLPLFCRIDPDRVHGLFKKPLLKGDGWGSVKATEMVLNNLLYLTVKFGDEHHKELETVWASLVIMWPLNLKIVIRYLLLITGISPVTLLPYCKRVLVYLARSLPQLVVEEMTSELQVIEQVPFSVEKISTAPFFKMTLTLVKNKVGQEESSSGSGDSNAEVTLAAESGVVYAKKLPLPHQLSSEECLDEGSSDSSSKLPTPDCSLHRAFNGNLSNRQRKSGGQEGDNHPYPLPMPAYEGYYAPLGAFFPSEGQFPINSIQRCFLSLLLLTDLIIDRVEVDWGMHIPQMLHIIFLGFDHSRSLIHEHCKKGLLNLMLVACTNDRYQSVAMEILTNNRDMEDYDGELVYASVRSASAAPTTPAGDFSLYSRLAQAQSRMSINSVATLVPENDHRPNSLEQSTVNILNVLSSRKNKPLWVYEDVTVKASHLKSTVQLSFLLRNVLVVFKEALPKALIDLRWAQTALQTALHCSSRHYAARSLQVFRAVRASLNARMLSEILNRLAEVVCEGTDEMQGFVSEVMLTLQSAVDNLELSSIGEQSKEMSKELFMSTPNLKALEKQPPRSHNKGSLSQTVSRHKRSTSISITGLVKKTSLSSEKSPPQSLDKNRSFSEKESGFARDPVSSQLTKSLSGHRTSLSSSGGAGALSPGLEELSETQPSRDWSYSADERLSVLVQLFWVATSLLESDYEHEFSLAVNLLVKVLHHLKPDRPECDEKLQKILEQIKWTNFRGLQALLLKGLTCSGTAEVTWLLLSRLTPCVKSPVLCPNLERGFTTNVMCLLPYLVQHYDDPTETCRHSAENIATMAFSLAPESVSNLGTVMRLYANGSFGKDALQWTKCVVKYLNDDYEGLPALTLTLLLEVLERGPPPVQVPILLIIQCLLHYVHVNELPSKHVASDMMATVSRFVEGSHWKEAQKILKLAVKSSSTLIMPASLNLMPTSKSVPNIKRLMVHTSFAEAEISVKKQLPGKTMEFSYDVTTTPVIGQKLGLRANEESLNGGERKDSSIMVSPSSSTIDSAAANNWRRPHFSQARTRERLVGLLAALGQRILPKSPSVIFSQISDSIEHQLSVCSSSEDTSVPDANEKLEGSSASEQQFGVLKDFDFLDIELEEEAGEDGADKFNWGVKRQHSQHQDKSMEVSRTPEIYIGPKEPIPERERSRTASGQSSDDEENSSGGGEEGDGVDAGEKMSGRAYSTTPRLGGQRARSLSVSSHSISSEPDLGDLSPCAMSSGGAQYFSFLGLSGDQVEEVWQHHAAQVMCDQGATQAVSTYSLFARLFKETKRKLSTLTKEACFYLSKTPSLRDISSNFLNTLEVLLAQGKCPYAFVDAETMTSFKHSEVHKFGVLELNEAYDTYLMRRTQTIGCLDDIKESIKLHSLGGYVNDFRADEQLDRIELCQCLYKLHFQLVVLHEGFMKLVQTLVDTAKASQVNDMSGELSPICTGCVAAVREMEGEDPTAVFEDETMEGVESVEKLCVEKLAESRYSEAVGLIRASRAHWSGGDRFGVTSDDDLSVLLGMYCRHLSETKPGIAVVCEGEQDSAGLTRRLLEVRLQLTAVMKQLSHTAKVEVAPKVTDSPTEKVMVTASLIDTAVATGNHAEKVMTPSASTDYSMTAEISEEILLEAEEKL